MLAWIIAAALFELNMSDAEKAQTGISRLTIQERAALERWIEDHHTRKTVAQNKKTDPVLQEVLRGGKFIRLSDGSLWEINPKDTPITQSWINPVEIDVKPADSQEYPYLLINSLTGSSVQAKKIQSIPTHNQ